MAMAREPFRVWGSVKFCIYDQNNPGCASEYRIYSATESLHRNPEATMNSRKVARGWAGVHIPHLGWYMHHAAFIDESMVLAVFAEASIRPENSSKSPFWAIINNANKSQELWLQAIEISRQQFNLLKHNEYTECICLLCKFWRRTGNISHNRMHCDPGELPRLFHSRLEIQYVPTYMAGKRFSLRRAIAIPQAPNRAPCTFPRHWSEQAHQKILDEIAIELQNRA